MKKIENNYTQTKETQTNILPEEVIEILKAGNKRFVEGRMLKRDLNQQISDTANSQFPFAAVLGCIDSRVPAEMVFDQGIGDLFNARVAGNFVNTDIIGSLEFACKVVGSKAIVVLGHTSCGAVKGACANVELGNLTHTLKNIKPAIELVEKEEGKCENNAYFVQKVADMNVRLTMENIRKQSPVLKEMEDKGEITIVGAMYDVATGKVSWFE
jgi:carbonic anhydrase